MALPPGLSRSRNLSDVRSKASSLANLLPVQSRGPTGADNSAAYTANQSFWAEPNGQLSQLQSLLPTGAAMWTPYANPGRDPGSVVAGAVFAGGTRRSVSSWTGNLFRAIRANDLTTLDVKVLPNGDPDLSSLAAFLAPTLGFGYIQILYDQSGAANDTLHSSLATMPRIDMATVTGTNLPMQIDPNRRSYWMGAGPVGNGRWPVTWSSGTTVTLTLLGATAAGCSINGTTATLVAPTGGTDNGFWRKNLVLSGSGVTAGTVLVDSQILSGDGGGGTWAVSPSQTVASTTITGTLPSVPPDLLPGAIVSSFTTPSSIPTAVVTGTISGTTFTVSTVTSGTVTAGQQLAGGPVFTSIISNISGSGVGSTWNIADTQTVASPVAFTCNTVVSSVNYTTGAIVLSCAPTAAPGSLVFNAQPVYMDFPNTMQVPWQSWSGVYSSQSPNGTRPFMLGIGGQSAFNGAANFSGPLTPGVGLPYGFRIFNGNNVGSSSAGLGGVVQSNPLVQAFSTGGTNGRDLNWQYDTLQGFQFQNSGAVPASTLSGGNVGFNCQLTNPAVGARTTPDWMLYDILIYPSTLTLKNINDITACINLARGWVPQAAQAYSCDGSSTTVGAGTNQMLAWGQQLGKRLNSVAPLQQYVVPQGSTIEAMWGNFGNFCGAVPAVKRKTLFVHFGLGNSLQSGGSFTATGQSGNTINVASTGNTALSGLGIPVSGTNIPAGAFTTAFTSTSVTLNTPPTGTVTTFSVLPDTAQIAWQNMNSYCANALTFGYSQIVVIGSASRKGFSATVGALDNFNTVKCYLREAALTMPGVVGYVDWENDPYMGSDGATMRVTGISGSTVTVNVPSNYVAVGNRVYWPGMLGATSAAIQAQISANTGGQYFATVSGSSFTTTGPLTGLVVGSTIQAVSPAPWSTWPGELELGEFGLNPDGQHFCRRCYWRQGDTVAQFALDNSLI